MRRLFSYPYLLSLCSLIGFTFIYSHGTVADPRIPDVGCFVRTYDPAHLARHPNQLVTNVRLALRTSSNTAKHRYAFALQLQMRGKKQTLKAEGLCAENGTARLHCFIECDGGGIELSVKSDRVMMYLDRIRMASCGNDINGIDTSSEVSGGLDDREFRLDRVGNHMCSNMGGD